ncbi:MAG: acid phosphatase [Gammaproteobacteria bacterium]|nr:acid phosphatase [Gammaproteobacteria bacterium]
MSSVSATFTANMTITALMLTSLAACQSTIPVQSTTQRAAHDNLNSVIWYQTSAEFRANSLQTYRQATDLLATAKNDNNWTAWPQTNASTLPPAIIVDIDETILDNSPSAAHDVLNNTGYSSENWDRWVSLAKAKAVPGAVAFVNTAEAMGIKVLYISNRQCHARAGKSANCPQKDDTLANLKAVGIQQISADQIWLKAEQPDWSSEKESRRQLAMQSYRVIMSVGDDFGDFLPNVKKNITPAQRFALVDQYQTHWGRKFFMLTNPTYGSWDTILNQPKQQYLQGF